MKLLPQLLWLIPSIDNRDRNTKQQINNVNKQLWLTNRDCYGEWINVDQCVFVER